MRAYHSPREGEIPLEMPEGTFYVWLEKSSNRQMNRPWVFAVRSPREHSSLEGAARSRRGADRQIRKFVALETGEVRRENKIRERREQWIRLLRRSGISEWDANNISTRKKLSCKQIDAGIIICSYRSSDWHGNGWVSTIYIEGKQVASSSHHRTRRKSRRQAFAKLQKFYEKSLLS